MLDTLKGSGARVIDAPAIKTDRDKADFAAHEFRRARRKATAEAVHATSAPTRIALAMSAPVCTPEDAASDVP